MKTNLEALENELIKAVNDNPIILDSALFEGNGLLTLTIKIGRPSQELINTIISKANQFDFRSV